MPSVIAHGVLDRVQQMAHTVREAGKQRERERRRVDDTFGQRNTRDAKHAASGADANDTRSIDEIRADILADLLLTGAPDGHAGGREAGDGAGALGAIRARVQVTVPVLSLIGRSDVPASLAGVGPLDPGTARKLAGGSTGWDRILTDPITGAVLAVDRYTRSQQLKRTLRVRDAHCRFPGCRLSVDRSDIDHTIDYAHGGATTLGNLAHLCRRHHTLKHATAWRVTQRPGGVLEWTSPTGRVYPDVPTSTVMFRPVHEPEPEPESESESESESDWHSIPEHADAVESAGTARAAGDVGLRARNHAVDTLRASHESAEGPPPF